MSSQEYRQFASESLSWAKTAKSEDERDIFLHMAQTWLEAAIRSEDGPTKVHRARHEVITRLACDPTLKLAGRTHPSPAAAANVVTARNILRSKQNKSGMQP
jgi:hypothetical protein